MNHYIHIGKFVATFGVKGELILVHALGKKTALKDVSAIFVEEQLEVIDTREAAHRIANRPVWLENEDFRRLAGKTSPISLLGFTLFNEGENLGPIEEVIEQPHQVLLRISLDGKEALIPLHDETLESIDRKKQEVHVTLPDGLLEVYR
jgi:16S rRNA processing protein RimM